MTTNYRDENNEDKNIIYLMGSSVIIMCTTSKAREFLDRLFKNYGEFQEGSSYYRYTVPKYVFIDIFRTNISKYCK